MKTKQMYKDLDQAVRYQGISKPKYMHKPGGKNVVMFEELFRFCIEKLLIWFDELHPLYRPKFLQSIFDFS